MKKIIISLMLVLISLIVLASAGTSWDIDSDNIDNSYDNCPDVHNPLQEDVNNNGIGDLCDPDLGKTLLLKSRIVMPSEGVDPALDIPSLPKRPHLFVQFDNIPTAEERALLQELGVNLQQYIHYNAWTASLDKVKISEIRKLPFVRYIGPILAQDKTSPSIKDKVPEHATNADGTVNLIVVFFKDVSQPQAEALLTDLEAISYKGPYMLNDYVVTINSDSINSLANEDLVQWIEAVSPPTGELNNQVREAVSANEVQAAPYNLDGAAVKVGMWELYNPDPTHNDLSGRITIVENQSITEHPTHVAGTLAGDGNLSNGTYRGIATAAEIYSFTTLNGYPEDHNGAINTSDIDLSQNSWGILSISYTGKYILESAKYDNIVTGVYGKKIPIIFAAGNSQLNKTNGFYTVAAPGATAKNTIAVGATNSYDGNEYIATYSTWGSSFGPTDDGRIKPDVMAPGCERSHDGAWYFASIWSTISPDTYGGKCGTSMAAPVVSGAIALMLEQFGTSTPLPSTLKAILIHTAADLDNPGPDFKSGYGRINVKAAIDTIIESDNIEIVEDAGISNGEVNTYTMGVSPDTLELKVTLVWDDEPGTPYDTIELINDLDLILIDPMGDIHYPWLLNHTNPGNAATKGADHLNNVEQVYVNDSLEGKWQINVTGYHIPNSTQDYSLVYQTEPFCNDMDEDGYGNPGDPICSNGDELDCDDSDENINPGASEACNSIDDDCDTLIDEVCIQINQGWNLFSPMFGDIDTEDRNISLSKGWNMFGYSGNEPFEWSSANVKNGMNTRNITQAASAGWLQSTIYYYNGTEYRYTPEHDAYLRQNRGYWLYALENDLTLILPGVGGSTSGQTYNWEDLRFYNGIDELNITQAGSAGWVDNWIRYYDNGDYKKVYVAQFPEPDSDKTTLSPWEGYFIYSYYDNTFLLTGQN